MVAVIDANGAEDIKKATDTLNGLDPTLPALLEEKEQPIDKTTNLFDLVDIECFTILAEAYKELEKRVADVEKQMKNKTKKEGSAEETEAVDAELQKTVKEKCNQFTNNVAKVIKDERGWMEELQTAVHNVQQVPAPAKEEPAAAENKDADKPAEAKNNENPTPAPAPGNNGSGSPAHVQAHDTRNLQGKEQLKLSPEEEPKLDEAINSIEPYLRVNMRASDDDIKEFLMKQGYTPTVAIRAVDEYRTRQNLVNRDAEAKAKSMPSLNSDGTSSDDGDEASAANKIAQYINHAPMRNNLQKHLGQSGYSLDSNQLNMFLGYMASRDVKQMFTDFISKGASDNAIKTYYQIFNAIATQIGLTPGERAAIGLNFSVDEFLNLNSDLDQFKFDSIDKVVKANEGAKSEAEIKAILAQQGYTDEDIKKYYDQIKAGGPSPVDTDADEDKSKLKPNPDPSSLTAKVDAIENDDAELNKICVQVYPKSAVTNPENTRTKVKDMLETIAVYFDSGEQDKVIDEIIKGAVTKCNTDGTQNKKAFVNAYADLYKRYSTCAKVLGVALPAAKPEKIDNDERINSYFTKGVDATNAEYDAKEAPTDFHDAEYNAEDDLVDILTSEAMKVIQNGEDENEIDAALNMYIQHFMDKDAYPFTEDELNQIKAKAKKAAMEKLKSSELGNGFNYDYSQDKTEPEKKYTIPSDITDAFADANDNDADKEYNNIMAAIDKGEDPTSLLNMVNNVGTYSNDTKKAIFAAIKQAHPEINVPEVKPMLSMDDMINGFDNTDNTKQTNGAESQNVPTPAPTPVANPAPTAEPTEEPRQLNAALNMPVNNAQEALRRRNETKAQAELNRYASLAAAAKTKVTPQVLEGLAMEVIDKAKAADRGEDVKGNTASIKSSLKNIYNDIAGSLPFRLGASKEKKDALALARTYLHDRMAAEGVDKYFVEMEEPEITYQNLIMECDIAIAREEKLKLITEQK